MKLKISLFGLIILFLVKMGNAQDILLKEGPVTIKGKFPPSIKTDTVVLSYYSPAHKVWEKVPVINGTFEIHGTINRVQRAYIYDVHIRNGLKTIYLEPGINLNVTASGPDWSSVEVKGGPAQADWLVFEKQTSQLEAGFEDSAKHRVRKLTPDEARAENKAHLALLQKEENIFIPKHPASYVSWDMVLSRSVSLENPDELETVFNIMDVKFRDSESGKGVKSRIDASRNNAIGKKVIDFAIVDTSGNEVMLTSFKGKYVLIDFWASWCGPCRRQTPTLKTVYEKYKNKNFTILGVSYDVDKSKWVRAIREEEMPWAQVSELKGMEGAPSAKQFGIVAIPQNVMLDPNGVIVARNIQLDEFDKKIGQIIGALN